MQEACQAVFTDAGHFEELDPYIPSDDTAQNLSDTGITIGTVYEAQDASGEKLGYVIQTTSSEGYGGNIVLYVGIRLDGTVMIFLFEYLRDTGTGNESRRCIGTAVPSEKCEELYVYQDRFHF